MMPKVALIAPAGVSGQIHASHSGKNYDISADGTVVVEAVDVAPLINGGYQHVPPGKDHRKLPDDPKPVTSDALGSQEVGASALDASKRETFHRPTPEDTIQQNQDHGSATPPHGEPQPAEESAASKADAENEMLTAMRAGVDTAPSELADTGHMGVAKTTTADQAEVREEVGGEGHEGDHDHE